MSDGLKIGLFIAAAALLIILAIAEVTIRDILLYFAAVADSIGEWFAGDFLKFWLDLLKVATFRVSWLDAPILPVTLCAYLYGSCLPSFVLVPILFRRGWKESKKAGHVGFLNILKNVTDGRNKAYEGRGGIYSGVVNNIEHIFALFFAILVFHCFYWFVFTLLMGEKVDFWGFDNFL